MHVEVFRGNILDNYNKDDTLLIIARVCIYIVVLLSFPVVHFAARESLFSLLNFEKEPEIGFWFIATAILCYSSAIFGSLVPNIAVLINLAITLCGITANFIFPIIFNFVLTKSKIIKIITIPIILLILYFSTISFVTAIIDIVNLFK